MSIKFTLLFLHRYFTYKITFLFPSRHVTQLSTNQVVTQTSKDIARLTVLMRRGDKQQKLQIEKLTTDFKDALQRYSDMQKVREHASSDHLHEFAQII